MREIREKSLLRQFNDKHGRNPHGMFEKRLMSFLVDVGELYDTEVDFFRSVNKDIIRIENQEEFKGKVSKLEKERSFRKRRVDDLNAISKKIRELLVIEIKRG
jgi:hypothetical protein